MTKDTRTVAGAAQINRKVIAHLTGEQDGASLIRCLTDIYPEQNFIDPIISVEENKLVTRRGLFFAHGLVNESELHYRDYSGKCWCESIGSEPCKFAATDDKDERR